MSETQPPPPTRETSAGALLRQMRESRGVDLDILASSLKVPARKLAQMEEDRFDELPGVTFVRSLALSVCRHLETDAAPVLALLPTAEPVRGELERVTRGLAAPFHEAHGGNETRLDLSLLKRRALWVPLAVLVAAAYVWFSPEVNEAAGRVAGRAAGLFERSAAGSAGALEGAGAGASSAGLASAGEVAAAAQAASDAALSASAVVETVFSVPPPELTPAVSPTAPTAPAAAAASAAGKATAGKGAGAAGAGGTAAAAGAGTTPATTPAAAAPAVAGSLVLRTTQASWVEVSDRSNKVLLYRMLTPGETVGVDGALPMHAKIGNAAGTEVTFRGRRIDLAPLTRDNIARVDLQ